MGKLAQTLAYGARTLLVRGDFDDCLRLVEEASGRLGVYLLNSINPFRIEGQKTIVLELLQQLGWEPPDWIVLPAGNLGNTAAFGKALLEAQRWGLISAAAAPGRGAGGGRGAVRAELRGGFETATPCGRRRWRPPSGSAIRRRSSAPCTRSGRPTASCWR